MCILPKALTPTDRLHRRFVFTARLVHPHSKKLLDFFHLETENLLRNDSFFLVTTRDSVVKVQMLILQLWTFQDLTSRFLDSATDPYVLTHLCEPYIKGYKVL